jgi:hypothetical protein
MELNLNRDYPTLLAVRTSDDSARQHQQNEITSLLANMIATEWICIRKKTKVMNLVALSTASKDGGEICLVDQSTATEQGRAIGLFCRALPLGSD